VTSSFSWNKRKADTSVKIGRRGQVQEGGRVFEGKGDGALLIAGKNIEQAEKKTSRRNIGGAGDQ